MEGERKEKGGQEDKGGEPSHFSKSSDASVDNTSLPGLHNIYRLDAQWLKCNTMTNYPPHNLIVDAWWLLVQCSAPLLVVCVEYRVR